MEQSGAANPRHYGGYFDLGDGVAVAGHILLDRRNTKLSLFSKSPITASFSDEATICGDLEDGRKITLLQCVRTGTAKHGFGGLNEAWAMTVFPNIVLIGTKHVGSAENVVDALAVHLPNAEVLFHDDQAFGMVVDPTEEAKQAIRRDLPAKHSSLGSDPEIYYFTGKDEIFTAQIESQKVSASHRPALSYPTTKGIRIDNKVWLEIGFQESASIVDALNFAHRTTAFMELVIGRPQSLVEVTADACDADGEDFLEVYCCMEVSSESKSDDPHPADNLMHAARNPEHFAGVLRQWLECDRNHRQSRVQFGTVFAKQHDYDTDKLVAAANMFDTLPDSVFPERPKLDKALLCAKKSARALFKALPATPERDSILNALGRVGSNTLKRKIGYRVDIVARELGEKLPRLDEVSAAAVDCRNHLVHGTPTKIDYVSDFELFAFLTDSLVFVYGAADLIDSGWNAKNWSSSPSSGSHPFSDYLANYGHRINYFERATGAVSV